VEIVLKCPLQSSSSFISVRIHFFGIPNINNGLHLARKYVPSSEQFSEGVAKGKLWATTEEQIMSKDKYPSIFSPQMEAIVFIVLQIFYETRAVLKIEEYSRPLLAGEYSPTWRV